MCRHTEESSGGGGTVKTVLPNRHGAANMAKIIYCRPTSEIIEENWITIGIF